MLEKHETHFDGTLGRWECREYDIELKPDAMPYHARPFPIPRVHEATLKLELDAYVKLVYLRRSTTASG